MSTQSNPSLQLPVALTPEVLHRVAIAHGTPTYVYSESHIVDQCQRFSAAIDHKPATICYAVKANSNSSIMARIFGQGFGADVVSGGEYLRVRRAGCSAERIVFSGVGKTEPEIRAALAGGLLALNVESLFELELIQETAAAMNVVAPIALRINPNIDAKTNHYIATGLYETKFGLSEDTLPSVLSQLRASRQLKVIGLACHIGSQMTDLLPIRHAVVRMLRLCDELKSVGFPITYLNMGGGLGIRYGTDEAPSIEDYGSIFGALRGSNLHLILEPGRILVGNSGVILTRVLGTKETPAKRFVVVDAGMTELIRPSLYHAHHELYFVDASNADSSTAAPTTVVGPICESSDFIAKDRMLPTAHRGDLIAVLSCGAYGSSMGSTYNSRPLAPEILVGMNGSVLVVRHRQQVEEIWSRETSVS